MKEYPFELPREKAIKYGIESLSEQELLALVLKSACANMTVFELANDLLKKAGGFQNLLSLNYEELTSIKGIKKAKALEILAIFEISKRLLKVEKMTKDVLTNPEKVIDWLRMMISGKDQEQFLVIFLNNQKEVLKHEILFKGVEDVAVVSIPFILRQAILLKAQCLIVAHNHPSDVATPSLADMEITDHLKEACHHMGIELLDHIIVGRSTHFSFHKEHLL